MIQRGSVLFLLFLFAFLAGLFPISRQYDTDIFWHLKTGEIIASEGWIPSTDPFTDPPRDALRERFLLASYWLADVVFYGVYAVGGLTALAILRSCVLSATILLVAFALFKRGFYFSIILSLALTVFLAPAVPLKPNLFSIVFTALVAVLVERFRENGRWRDGIGVVGVMFVWTNMHGGYVFGLGFLILYLIGEAAQSLVDRLKGRESSGRLRDLTVLALCGGLASLANPVGADAIRVIRDISFNPSYSWMTSLVMEHMSVAAQLTSGWINLWTFYGVILAGIVLIYTFLNVSRGRTGMAETVVVVGYLAAGLSAVRMLPLFLVAGMVVSGRRTGFVDLSPGTRRWMEPAKWVATAGVLGVSLAFLYPLQAPGTLTETSAIGVRAAGFLKEQRFSGHMLNSSHAGNYFIFSLYPDYKVFTDTRYLSVSAFRDSFYMLDAVSREPRALDLKTHYYELAVTARLMIKNRIPEEWKTEFWRDLLEKYDIKIIVDRATNPQSGSLYGIWLKLFHDDAWKLVYADGNFAVMVKDEGQNAEIVARIGTKDKKLLFDQAIAEVIGMSTDQAYETLAFSYYMKGEYDRAEKLARAALIGNEKLVIANSVLEEIKKNADRK